MKYTWKVPYLQAILITSCILLGALVAYNSLVVYPSFSDMLTENTEEESVRIASYLMEEVIDDRRNLRIDEAAGAKIMDAQKQFRLWKLKIFSASGETVYSTDPSEIGNLGHSDIFFDELPRGEILSNVVQKDGRSTEGSRVAIDIVETYVPIFGQEQFLGAFEIYYDITQRKAMQEQNLKNATMVSSVIAFLFFCVLIIILERTGKSIVERKQAEQKLREFQHQLVEAEKMASLGGLVAGVAHEINTPVGAAVTVASTLEERTRKCRELLQANQIKRSDLQKYFETASSSSTVILTSLRQAAELIKSFKQVAVDQSCDGRRTFPVRQCIDDVLLSLKPKFRQGVYDLKVDCPEDLEINNDPGAISQIITNLIVNSLTHAFAPEEGGEIAFDVRRDGDQVRIRYADNGRGMDQETQQRMFEPFFTTKRGQGGSGLGMHIVYNLVTQKLGGTIECDSAPGQGTTFTIHIPLS